MRGQPVALSFAFMTLEVRGEGGADDKPSTHRRGDHHPTGSDPPRRPIRAWERHVSKVFVLDEHKGTQTAAEFGFPLIQAQAKAPLTDAAAVNATRWALYRRLLAGGLTLETGTGGRTQWNRTRRGLPKTHWRDAAGVGASTPQTLHVAGVRPLVLNQGTKFDLARGLSDRSRRGLPCDRSRRPAAHQTKRSETTLVDNRDWCRHTACRSFVY
jgi:hypothetical protein